MTAPEVLLDEHFVRTGAWPDDASSTAWVARDGYRLFARTPGKFVAIRSPLGDVPAEVTVESTIHKVGGPPGGGYGLILSDQRVGAGDGVDQTGQYVVAAVGDTGQIGIWRRDGDAWRDLVPWKPSQAVHVAAAPNTLSAHVVGGRLTFSVNGMQVAAVETGLQAGRVGLYTGGDDNEVAIDGFIVQAPAVAAARPPVRPAVPTSTPVALRPPLAPVAAPPVGGVQRARELLTSILRDVGAILQSFANGPESRNPVTDSGALKEANAHLDSATSKAEQLATELQKLQNGGAEGGH